MKIVVFGATGGLGSTFLEVALANNHQIVAYARSPEKMTIEHENLEVVEGDVFDAEKITETLKGVDAIFMLCGLLGNVGIVVGVVLDLGADDDSLVDPIQIHLV